MKKPILIVLFIECSLLNLNSQSELIPDPALFDFKASNFFSLNRNFQNGILPIEIPGTSDLFNPALGMGLPRSCDIAIDTIQFKNFTETLVSNPEWAVFLNRETSNENKILWKPSAIIKNVGMMRSENIQLHHKVYKDSNILHESYSNQFISLDFDSTGQLYTEDVYLSKFIPFNSYPRTLNYTYSVKSDTPDSVEINNQYKQNFITSSNILSKGRFDFNRKSPISTFYYGGRGPYNELMIPFRLNHARWATIDSIFVNVASKNTLAGAYSECRLFLVEDLDHDSLITSDELLMVAEGSYTFPQNYSKNNGVVRCKFDDLIGNPQINKYTVEKNNVLFLASVVAFTESQSYFGFDTDYSQRLTVNTKERLGILKLEEWPYIFSSKVDTITGGPDLKFAGLISLDENNDGIVQEREKFYANPSIALEINYPPLAGSLNIGEDIQLNLELSPNPVSEFLELKFSTLGSSKLKIQIISNEGNLIFSQDAQSYGSEFHTRLNLSNLHDGMYFIKVNTDKGYAMKAFSRLSE